MPAFAYIRDHNDIRHLVTIPTGWRRVRRGALVPGDCYLNLAVLTERNAVEWRAVEDEHLRTKPDDIYSSAEWYSCLIRRDWLG